MLRGLHERVRPAGADSAGGRDGLQRELSRALRQCVVPRRRRTEVNAETDSTLRQIDLTVRRLLLTHDQVPTERRAGFLEARRRLQRARVRRFRQLH